MWWYGTLIPESALIGHCYDETARLYQCSVVMLKSLSVLPADHGNRCCANGCRQTRGESLKLQSASEIREESSSTARQAASIASKQSTSGSASTMLLQLDS